MKKAKKVALIVALILVVAGAALFAAGFAMMDFDFKGVSSMKYTTPYPITEDFSSIDINVSVSDIAFIVSEDGESRVECYEDDRLIHTVAVNDGVLCIGEQKSFNIFNFTSINFDNGPRVTLYLSRTQFDTLNIKSDTSLIVVPREFSFEIANIDTNVGNVSYTAPTARSLYVKATTGRITVSDISLGGDIRLQASTGNVTLTAARAEGNIYVRTTTGKLHLESLECTRLEAQSSTGNQSISDVTCGEIYAHASTGHASFTNVISRGGMNIETDTGNIKLDRCDGAELYVETDTGHVTGTLLSDKIFLTHSDTGRISVPKSVTGGKCEINTDTGNITITIAE